MRALNVRRWLAIMAFLVAVGSGPQASAQNFDLDFTPIYTGMGLVALSLGNTGLAFTEVAFTTQGRRSYGLAIASLLAAGVGIAAGAMAVREWQEGPFHTLGVVSLVTSGLNLAFAAVQLFQPLKKERQDIALAPVTLVDSSGQLTAGAGLTGRF
jgi:peptidoglycan/LPS O-acetylase OafA/YrhL